MIQVNLPWPPKALSPNARRPTRWTAEEDQTLRDMYAMHTRAEIAAKLGRTESMVRARCSRLGLNTKAALAWSQLDIEILRAEYAKNIPSLNFLAKKLLRHKTNIARKARVLGLTNQRRIKVLPDNRRIRKPKFNSKEELLEYRSNRMKEWYAKNPHPRGALGMKHSPETRALLGEKWSAYWASLSPEEREQHTTKSVNGRKLKGFSPPRLVSGSWKAGWREIGGRRNFYRSRWEANYAHYLQWLKVNGQIMDWEHEPETFWFEAIRRGVRSYKPDFRVYELDGSSALHEVKGWMDSRSRTSLKRMAKYFPNEKLIVIDGRQYRAIRRKVMGLINGWEDSARDARL